MQHGGSIVRAQKPHGPRTADSSRRGCSRGGAVQGFRRAWRGAAIFLLVPIACAALLAAQGGEPDAGEPVRIMKVEQVRPGMRGYGLTTFKGAQVQRFEVEVLGVMRDQWTPPQGTIVLVRMFSRVLEEAGVVGGMSGSPVYIGDKLLGAVAYGWSYSKIPLAGVTPIEEMLVARDIDRAAAPSHRGGRKAATRGHLRTQSAVILDALRSGKPPDGEALSQVLGRMVVPLFMQTRPGTYAPDIVPPPAHPMFQNPPAAAMAPLPVPLAIGGVGPEVFGALVPMLRMGGFVPVPAGVPAEGGEEIEIAPGAPIGAVLIAGDMDVSAMGTLTMVDGDRVLAFGHPMFGSGESNYPLALGRVQTVVPSLYHSFRVSTVDRVIGRITQDRESAIVGRLGQHAPMFPCTVTVKGARDVTFRYKVAGYWETAPFLAYYATAASVYRWEGAGNLVTVKARSRISLKGRKEPIILENQYAGLTPMGPALGLVWLPIEMMVLNPFQEMEVAGLEVELEVEQGLRAAWIESVRTSHREVAPGEKINLFVRLKEFQGEEHLKKIEVQVPPDAKPGSVVQVHVSDSLTELALMIDEDRGFFEPKDLAGLIANIERLPHSTHIFARASFLKRGVRYGGVAMPDLPSSVHKMLSTDPEAGVVVPLSSEVKTHLETPWVIMGSGRVSVVVREPERGGARY